MEKGEAFLLTAVSKETDAVHRRVFFFFRAYVAHQAFEENQLCLQLLNSEGQFVLATLALLQVLHAGRRGRGHARRHVRRSI